jgi:hypothetical protein
LPDEIRGYAKTKFNKKGELHHDLDLPQQLMKSQEWNVGDALK